MRAFLILKALILLILSSLLVLQPGIAIGSSPDFGLNQSNRSLTDQVDDYAGAQIHVFYVIPSDGTDRELDIDGTLELSINAFSLWFYEKTEYELKFDLIDGQIDITFYQLNDTDAEMQSNGAWVVTELENTLENAGLLTTDKINLIYYDGTSNWACGGAAWPPSVPGRSAAMYLQAQPNREGYSANCAAQTFTSSINIMRYWEFAMLHDLFHVLGAAPTCAPNQVYSGHVSDDNTDLMYSGSLPWNPNTVDINNDDYFGHDNPDCLDVQDSNYLQLDGETTTSLDETTSTDEMDTSTISPSTPSSIPTTTTSKKVLTSTEIGLHLYFLPILFLIPVVLTRILIRRD